MLVIHILKFHGLLFQTFHEIFLFQAPRLTEDEEIVESLKYQRKLYGVYGAASGINVAKLWPSREELELEKEYEKVARPYTVQEMIRMARKTKEEEEEAQQQR